MTRVSNDTYIFYYKTQATTISGSSKIINHVKGHFSRRLFKGVKIN